MPTKDPPPLGAFEGKPGSSISPPEVDNPTATTPGSKPSQSQPPSLKGYTPVGSAVQKFWQEQDANQLQYMLDVYYDRGGQEAVNTTEAWLARKRGF